MKDSFTSEDTIKFLRKRDYKFVRVLGQGACGKTVLLYDELIGEHFVCKKYIPCVEDKRLELYNNFVREIKLLHKVYHKNVVRVFNFYLYPDMCAGYILMEYINGLEIDKYIEDNQDRIGDLFLQAINGFKYLEDLGILHRDIRLGNLMVSSEGLLKIIDFGFGKSIEGISDYDKSISLNWWCETPNEFSNSIYDFKTEVYFVGKLFEQIIKDYNISNFMYMDLLASMCHKNPETRIISFNNILQNIQSGKYLETSFDYNYTLIYREFSNAICKHIARIESGTKYITDINKIKTNLVDAYKRFMLEEYVPDSSIVTGCFLTGKYYYRKTGLEVEVVKQFITMFKQLPDELCSIILANLHTKFDSLQRYTETEDEDIPF